MKSRTAEFTGNSTLRKIINAISGNIDKKHRKAGIIR